MTACRSHETKERPAGQSDIYALPIGRHHLVYAPLHCAMALVNATALDVVRRWRRGAALPESQAAQMDHLIQRLDAPPCYPAGRSGDFDPIFLGIIPTRACNLACRYCNFGAHQASGASLDIGQACAAVDWMARQAVSRGRPHLDIHFFGGEPFVADDVIEAVVHRARAIAAQKDLIPRFEVATNGVFNGSKAAFVGDYFDTVVLSWDGFQPMHDRQRPMAGGAGSFDKVQKTAERLSRSATDLCLRICVTRENLDQLEPFTHWFGRTYRPAIINIETLKPTGNGRDNGLCPPDPFEFAIRCVKACRSIEALGIEAIYAAADIASLKQTFCPVGNDAAILSPDGRISSCYLLEAQWQERGLDMNIGRQTSGQGITIDPEAVNRLRNLVTHKPRCRSCFCRWTCAGGCHVSETYPDCRERRTDFCVQTRIVTACFLLQRLELSDVADNLLADENAMHRLAFQKDDGLESW
jgi:uncharacterized protein